MTPHVSDRELVARALVEHCTTRDGEFVVAKISSVVDAVFSALGLSDGTRGWQPIETAPKDGTKFDAWCVHPETGGLGVRFTDVQMRGDDSGFGFIYYEGGTTRWNYIEQGDAVYPSWKLAYWMPLPAPPAAQEAGDGK